LRIATLTVVTCLLSVVLVMAQGRDDDDVTGQLQRLFPDAQSFSEKEGNPPHFKAFGPPAASGGEPALLGLAYWTTELEPLERGYDGPIKMLVGMDPKGVLTGIVLVDHREPYGDFSIELPEFAAQFVDKNVREAFRVGDDIDAVSRATITVTSASRAVRNSSRRIARAYLVPPEQ
jgi:NosR/NirI family nitrous oxide reductase transcriptional regulator